MPSCLYPTYVTRAVGSPDLRSDKLIFTEESSDRHISFCNKFRATKQSTPRGESSVEAWNHHELVLLHVSFSDSRVVSQLFLAELFFSSLMFMATKELVQNSEGSSYMGCCWAKIHWQQNLMTLSSKQWRGDSACLTTNQSYNMWACTIMVVDFSWKMGIRRRWRQKMKLQRKFL